MTKPILIVGAGPTGLMLALWLSRLGAPFRIIDKDEGPGETSRAMAVQARTLEFYRQIGLAEDVVQHGLPVESVAIRQGGSVQGRLKLGRIGEHLSPYPFVLVFPQDRHERLLLSHLDRAGVAVERRTELTGFTEEADGIRATVRTPEGTTETLEASYIAGCDGAHSTVRSTAGIPLPGGTYAHRFYVADADVAGDAAQDGMNLCATGRDFCIVFPLDQQGRARLIGIVPDEVTREEVRFEDVAESVRRNTALEVRKIAWFSSYKVHHRVSEHFRAGRAFLLGDAAHLHSPVGGQGMNTGLGDAANLAWKLASVLAGGANPAILDSYEPERIGFARRLVATTDRAFQIVTDTGPLGAAWRSLVMARLMPRLLHLPAAGRTLFKVVSQIRIAYPESPLSAGRAGSIRGGDRLPWVAEGGSDNFAPLASLAWQIHVFGEMQPKLREVAERSGIAIHEMPWGPASAAKGFARDAAYLIRPDGHVAIAGADAEGLQSTIEKWGLHRNGS